ncbi:GLPGLI family protein [Chryseobacterium polytrichastri]|uniref:GLPGLI family protein n=1 Tax=Chryseobacterium polytrichastri TaxID=1302687 RepID=A0A1M7IZE5_9FLAO|nr:GLPGLI family protein [Chryseobacterium polytrichastri]SHM46075.1 GLPGLI family protein [Chryseobacterium polytrichastri]
MIKKSTILLFLFLLNHFYSQNYRALYKFDYKRDSSSTNYTTMNMVLDLQKQYTKFYFQKQLKFDSLIKINKRVAFSIPLQQIIKRNSGSFANENFVNVDDRYYTFSSSDEMKWKISDSIKNYNIYKLQKAETNWGGRKWIAWFSTEIPIAEGPYKFRGLPGLIMQLLDTRNNFSYNLISFKKLDSEFDTHNVVETNLGDDAIKINLSKYQKLLLNVYGNPFSEFENMKNQDWQLEIYDKKIKTIEGLNEIKSQYQLDIKRYYNPIELDRAVKYPKK